jgi:hypothetical protein
MPGKHSSAGIIRIRFNGSKTSVFLSAGSRLPVLLSLNCVYSIGLVD